MQNNNRFMLPLKPEQRLLYAEKLLEMTDALSLEPEFKFQNQSKLPMQADMEQIKNSVLRFRFHRKNDK